MRTFKSKNIFYYIAIFTICLSFILSLINFNNNTSVANAATNSDQEQQTLDCESLIASTLEEYSDLKEVTYPTEIENEIEKTGMTVGESLVDQLCYYQELLFKAEDEQEVERLNHLIEATKNIIELYQKAAESNYIAESNSINEINDNFDIISNRNVVVILPDDFPTFTTVYTIAASAVPLAIAWFNSSNYLLSAELLTHAWFENFFPGDYVPQHQNRVVGSPVTYNFINSNLTSSPEYEFPETWPDPSNNTTCYQEDLAFAIHGIQRISRSSVSSTKIRIEDTYDFAFENVNDVLDALTNIFAYAQYYEIIGAYKIIIDVDVSDSLYLKLNSTTNGVHSITAYNYSNEDLNVAYNTKMCNPDDAKTFFGISDINFIKIPAKSSRTVNISENLLASHITFCYTKGGYRVVTYADELYLNRQILNFTFNKSQLVANDLAIIAAVDNKWLVQVKNIYSTPMEVEYNSKLCNWDDAETWTGLKDIKTLTLCKDEAEFVYIEPNYFADTIAVKFSNNSYEYYVYANNLNRAGGMSIGRRTSPVYTYLSIKNKGKTSEGWNIEITNPYNYEITVWYNIKMCNYNDAKNWTGLNDTVFIEISEMDSCTVTISENWFATSIAISYLSNGYRLISYADGLSTNGSMNVYNNKVNY